MMDQAEKLREIINNIKIKQLKERINSKNQEKRNSKVIAITSGKGGVGKSNITINLALALSEAGHRVTILDADFGLANVDVLLGIVPQYTLVDVIHNRKNIFEVLSEGPKNIKFISGGSGVEDLIKLEKSQLEKFLANINLLDKMSDVLLIDTGAGLSENVISFIMAADEVLLITTPEPTSITDAYALIKTVSNKDKDKVIKLIVNRAESVYEGNDILSKLTQVADKFLNIKLEPLGFILQDEFVIKAVKTQQPFFISYPKSYAAKYIKEISQKIIKTDTKAEGNDVIGIKGFVNRLVGLINTVKE